jgi:hypothetical protein
MRAPQLDNRNRERTSVISQKSLELDNRHRDKTGVISRKSLELDNRHRDKTGMISRKHGNTLVGTLRKQYGPGFAANFKDTDKLSDVLAELDTPSLAKVIRNVRVRVWAPQFAQKTKEWLPKNTESSVSYHGHVHVKMARKHYVPLPAKTSEGSDMGARVLRLSERDSLRVFELLENPPVAPDRLVRAAKGGFVLE